MITIKEAHLLQDQVEAMVVQLNKALHECTEKGLRFEAEVMVRKQIGNSPVPHVDVMVFIDPRNVKGES